MSDLKKQILSAVEDDLQAIEQELVTNLTPHLALVRKVASHILFSGGKRLRPLLMVLAARICNYQGNYDKTFSTIFEYLHAATLLHDDLIDGARLRRGRLVAHSVWDNPTAVLVGDFLLARGLAIAAETGLPQVIKVIAHITEEMSQGEIHQLQRKKAFDLTEAEYMEIIRRKTAVLFQGACRISALLAEATPVMEAALADYGLHLGMAFQMADDLLDYTTDSAVLGKQVGADLKEGKLTLPVIHALANAENGVREEMIAVIGDPGFSTTQFEKLVQQLASLGGIDYTWRLAHQHIQKAKDALHLFPATETRQIMLDIADYALSRKL
jgi:octaprenyl-diphosphate synthase